MAIEACSNTIMISIRLVEMDFNLPYMYTATIIYVELLTMKYSMLFLVYVNNTEGQATYYRRIANCCLGYICDIYNL